jgi:hypothetical protein
MTTMRVPKGYSHKGPCNGRKGALRNYSRGGGALRNYSRGALGKSRSSLAIVRKEALALIVVQRVCWHWARENT